METVEIPELPFIANILRAQAAAGRKRNMMGNALREIGFAMVFAAGVRKGSDDMRAMLREHD